MANQFTLDEFWIFSPFPAGLVQQYFEALKRLQTRDAVEQALDLPAGAVALELLKLDKRIAELRRKPGLSLRYFGPQTFTLCGGSLRVYMLVPGDEAKYKYNTQLSHASQEMLTDGPVLRASAKLPQVEHNLASGGMLIEYGQTRLLLMADGEEELWRECLGKNRVKGTPVHFLKVAHHGSQNGYHQPLYAQLANPSQTLAVITPFNQGRKKLPPAEGIRHIHPHVRELLCTNRIVARQSTGLSWEEIGVPASLPPLPLSWAARIMRERDLAACLYVSGTIAAGGSPRVLPTEWIKDCRRNPDLLRLIRPEYRTATACGQLVMNDHRVSVFFDDRGQELEREIGAGVGRYRP